MKQKILGLQTIYKEGERILADAGIEEAALDAWYLLSFVTGISKALYLCEPHAEISEEMAEKYWTYIARRAKRIPLQHITGEQEFMGYTFQVNEHVLIPRQDTEILVEEALKYLRPGMKALDMCTGSGCILLSLLKMGKERYYIGNVSGTGADISQDALSVANANAKALEVEATFVQSDLFENVEGTYDIFVSNPPYIRTDVIEGLQDEVKLHDPYIALDGKEDGLYFYRKIIEGVGTYLNEGARVLFEIGHDQGKDVSKLMADAGFADVTVKKDLAGLDRVVSGVYNNYNCAHK